MPFGLWLGWMALTFPEGEGFGSADAYDVAQLARHIARGDGFVTSAIQPLSVKFAPRLEDHPSLKQPPLFPMWEAVWFRISGARPVVAAFATGSAWLVCIWLIRGLALALFGREVAFFAIALFLTNLAVWRASSSGTPPLFTAALFTGFLWALAAPPRFRYQAEKEPSEFTKKEDDLLAPGRRVALSALLGGLTVLSDTSLATPVLLSGLVYWVLWPVWASRGRRSLDNEEGHRPSLRSTLRRMRRQVGRLLWLRLSLLFLAVSLLVLVPWVVRNIRVANLPYLSLSRYDVLLNTYEHPGYTVYRHFPAFPLMEPWQFPFAHPLQTARKVAAGLNTLGTQGGALFGYIAIALFVVGCFRPPEGLAGRLQRYTLAILVLDVCLLLLASQQFDRLLAFAPAVCVFGAATVYRLACREAQELTGPPFWMRPRIRALWIAVAVSLVPMAAGLASFRRLPVFSVSDNVEWLKKETPSNAVIMTDSPWLVAWHADRPCVWLTQEATELVQMQRQAGPVSWLYFTAYRLQVIPFNEVSPWWMDACATPRRFGEFERRESHARNEFLLENRSARGARVRVPAGS
ncbi:MAG: hypothetical protein QHJ73_14620 [Armatimonadota bacterium]|nr:hypothetical protein [Armatimonadota bacterium]